MEGYLNRTLFEQEPGKGGKDGATPTGDEGREEARARGGGSAGDSLRPSAAQASERSGLVNIRVGQECTLLACTAPNRLRRFSIARRIAA
jgi:hypothetical protein